MKSVNEIAIKWRTRQTNRQPDRWRSDVAVSEYALTPVSPVASQKGLLIWLPFALATTKTSHWRWLWWSVKCEALCAAEISLMILFGKWSTLWS